MKPRNRVVVFRLTQEEYERLKATSASRGARNLSDFTRSELLAESRPDSLLEVVQGRFAYLDQKLKELESLLRHVARRIEGLAIVVLDEERKAS